jgi:hypothetical protein
MGRPLQTLIAGSQPADSSNKLATIVSISGISLLLKFTQISNCLPTLAICQYMEAYSRHKSQHKVLAQNGAGKYQPSA